MSRLKSAMFERIGSEEFDRSGINDEPPQACPKHYKGNPMETKKEVFSAINRVQSDLAAIGIAKDSTNKQQNFKFRGIDAVYNALAPLLAKHELLILPRIISRVPVR